MVSLETYIDTRARNELHNAYNPWGMVSTVQKCSSWTCMLRLFAQNQRCKNPKDCNTFEVENKGQDVEKKEIFPMLAMLARFTRGSTAVRRHCTYWYEI